MNSAQDKFPIPIATFDRVYHTNVWNVLVAEQCLYRPPFLNLVVAKQREKQCWTGNTTLVCLWVLRFCRFVVLAAASAVSAFSSLACACCERFFWDPDPNRWWRC